MQFRKLITRMLGGLKHYFPEQPSRLRDELTFPKFYETRLEDRRVLNGVPTVDITAGAVTVSAGTGANDQSADTFAITRVENQGQSYLQVSVNDRVVFADLAENVKSVTVQGSQDADQLVIDPSAIPVDGISFQDADGSSGAIDTLVVTSSNTTSDIFANATYALNSEGGSVSFGSASDGSQLYHVTFAGIEQVTDQLGVANRAFNIGENSATLQFNAGSLNTSSLTLESATPFSITFTDPDQSLTMEATSSSANDGQVLYVHGDLANSDLNLAIHAGSQALVQLDANVNVNQASVTAGSIIVDNATVLANDIQLTATNRLEISATGRLESPNGNIELTAPDLQHRGVIDVGTGTALLDAGASGQVTMSGSIHAQGLEAGQHGGTVHIFGELIELRDHAEVNASGLAGGGEILIGGDFQGVNPLYRNSLATLIGPQVNLIADAVQEGDGGRVVIWADNATYFYGNINARGGSVSGNGGFVEVSGLYLDFDGIVCTLAANGSAGTLLLDPFNLTISNNTGTNTNVTVVSPIQPTASGSNIRWSTIVGLLASNNVTVTTVVTPDAGAEAGNITVINSVSYNSSNNLTIHAVGDININTGNTITNNGTGDLILTVGAGKTVNVNAALTLAGDLTINGDTSFTADSTIAGTVTIVGAVSITADLAVSGAFSVTGTGTISGNITGTTTFTKLGAGNLTLSGTNTFSGDATVSGGTLTLNGGAAINNATAVILSDTTGVILILNSDETIGSLDGGGANGGNVTLGANTLTTGGNGDTTSYAGIITGTGNFIKAGLSTMTLSGLSTYSGTTTIRGGTIIVANNAPSGSAGVFGNATSNITLGNNSGTNNAAIIVNGNYTVARNITVVTGNTGTMTIGGSNTTGTSNFTGNIVANKAVTLVTGSGGSTTFNTGVISGSGVITVTASGGTITLGGTNTFTDDLTLSAGRLVLANAAALGTTAGNTTIASGAVIDLNGISGIAEDLDVSGTGIASTGVLINSSATAAGVTGDVSSTGGTYTVAGTGAITLSGAVSGTLTKNGNNLLTLSGATNNAGLTVTLNAGTLALAKDSSGTVHAVNSGTLTVNGGVLQLGGTGGDQIASGVTVSLDTNAVFDLNGVSETITTLSGSGSIVNDLDATDVVLGVNNGAFSGVISDHSTGTGTVGLRKLSAGTLTLSGLNTYSGGTAIDQGTLAIGIDNALLTTGSVTLGLNTTNGNLDLAGFNQEVGGLATGTGASASNQRIGNSSTTSNSTLTFSGGSSNFDGVIQNVFGAGNKVVGLTVASGTLTLGGTNAYTGNTLVTGGTLKIDKDDTLSDNTSLTINGGSVDMQTFNDTVASVTLNAGSLTGTTGVLTSTATIQATNSGTFAVTGRLGGTAGLTMSGSGTLSFENASGGNTYTGTTTINSGKIEICADNQLANTSTVTINGGTLDMLTFNDTVQQVTLTSGTLAGTTGVLTSTNQITANPAGTFTVSGRLGGANGLSKTGAGTLVFSNASGGSTYTGTTTLTAGTIQLGASNQLANTSSLTLNGGTFNSLTFDDTVQLVTLTSGTLTGTTGVLTSTNQIVANPTTLVTVSGRLGGTNGLAKSGAGTLLFNNASGGSTYTGTTTITAGVLRLGADDQLADGSSLTVNGGTFDIQTFSDTVTLVTLTSGTIAGTSGVLTSTNAFAVSSGTISAILGGTNGLTKTTTGTVTLSGINTYTGATAVNGGRLVVTGSLAAGSAVTVGNNATLSGTGSVLGTLAVNSGGTLAPGLTEGVITSGDLDLNTGGTLAIDIHGANVGTGYDQLSVTGAVDLSGSTLSVDLTGFTPAAGSIFVIIANDGVDAVIGTFNGIANGGTVIVGLTTFLVYYNGGDGNDVILVEGSVALGNMYVDDATNFGLGHTPTFGEFILDADFGTAGNQSALYGINAFSSINSAIAAVTLSGQVIVNAGTYSEAVNLNKAVTLKLTESSGITTNSFASIVGSTINTNGNTLRTGDATNTTIAGVISGSGSLIKQGTGTLTLSGNNTFSGGTTIEAGTLALGVSNALTTGSTLTLGTSTTNGTLDLRGFNQQLAGIAVGAGANAGSQVIGNSSTTSDSKLTFNGGTSTFDGVIQDTLGLGSRTVALEVAGGTLTLSGTNTFTGAATVTGGTLRLGASDVLADGAAVVVNGGTFDVQTFDDTVAQITLTSGTLAGTTGVLTSSATIVANPSGTVTVTGRLGGTNGLTKSGGGTLTFNNASGNTYTGATTINNGTIRLAAADQLADASTITISGGSLDIQTFNDTVSQITLSSGSMVGSTGVLTSTNTILATPAGTFTVSGRLGGTAGLTMSGAGILLFNNASGGNTYTGETSVTAGTIRLNAADQFDDGSTLRINGGTFDVQTFNDTVSLVTLSSGTLTGTTGVLTSTNTIVANPSTSFTVSGRLGGTNGLNMSGTGTLTLNNGAGGNTYIGDTTISSGTVVLGTSNQLANGSTVTVSGGVLNIQTFSDTVSRVTLVSGSINGGSGTLTSTNTILVESGTISAILAGGNGLTKSTAGTVTLSGANTFTGATAINGGTLLVTGSTASGSAVTVNSGGTLGGTGSVLGTMSVLSGGTVAPGVTVGSLNSGNVTLASGATLDVEIQGPTAGVGYDRLNVTGTVNLTGSTLNIDLGVFVPPTSSTFTIISNDGSDAVVGTFNGIVNGGTFVVGGTTFLVFYTGGDGNDVVLVEASNPAGTVYVDDSTNFNLGHTPQLGENIVDADLGTPGNQSAVFGVNAFSSINTAISIVTSSGTIIVNAGTYNEAVNLNKTATIVLTQGTGITTNSFASIVGSTIDLKGNTLQTGDATNTTIAGQIIGGGGVTKVGTGTLTLTGTNLYTGTTNVNAGTLQLGANDVLANPSSIVVNGGTLDIQSYNDAVSQVTLDSGTITGTTGVLNSNNTIQVRSGTISAQLGGNNGLTKTTAGTVTLSGINSYNGTTTISAGTLNASGGQAIPDGSSVVIANVAGAILNLLSDEAIGDLSGGGTTGGEVTLGSNTLTTGGNNLTSTFSGTISGNGGLTKVGTGIFTLAGTNTYIGTTTINGGTLTVNGGSAIADASAVVLADAPGVRLNLGSSETIGSLAGGGVSGGNVTLGSNTLTVGADNTSTNYVGSIGGTGSVTKTGSGTLSLTGSSSYSGTTTVQAGTLQAGANDVLADNSSLNINGGTFDIQTFTDTVALITLTSGSLTGTTGVLTSTNAIQATNAGTFTVSGRLGGTNGLTMSGTGTLLFNNGFGGSTYTGNTLVTAGILRLGASNQLADGSSLTMNGGTVDLQTFDDTVSLVTLTSGSLTGTTGVLTSTNTIQANNAGTFTVTGRLGGGNGLSKSGTGTLLLNNGSGGNTYTGETNITGGVIRLAASDQLADGSTLTISGGSLDVQTFNDTVSTVTLSSGSLEGTTGVVTSANAIIANPSGTFAVNGRLGGSNGLTMTGTGTLIFNNASGGSTYTGATAINNGTLRLGASNQLADGSTVTVSSGTFDIQTFDETVSQATLLSGNILGTTGLLTSTNTILIESGTASARLAGSNGLTKSTAGTATLSGTNSYTGGTTINGGTLNASGGAAIPDTSSVVLANVAGAILNITSNETIGDLRGGGAAGGNVTLGSNTLITGGSNASTTYSGSMSGTGGFTKVGTGEFTLDGINTYSGATTINGGTLTVNGGAAIADNSAVVLANTAGVVLNVASSETIGSLSGGGATGGNVTLGANTLSFGSDNTSTTYAGSISGTGNVTKVGNGTLTLTGSNSFTGTAMAQAGTLKLGANNVLSESSSVSVTGGTFDIQNFNDTIAQLTLDSGSIVGTTGVLTSTNTIQIHSGTASARLAGSNGLTKSTSGTATIAGTNSYLGTTTINAGTLHANGGSAIPDTSSVVLSNVNGAILNLGADETIGDLSGGGAAGGNVTLGSNTLTIGGNNVSSTYSGTISGTGGLTKVGTGEFILAGINTYSGATTVNGGMLSLSNGAALADNSAVVLANTVGVTLNLNANETIGSLAGGGIAGGHVTLGANTLSVGADNTSTSYAGSIGGTGGIIKVGSGTLTLASSSTFSGTAAIQAGELRMGANDVFADVASVTINGGTLQLLTFSDTVSQVTLTSGSLAGTTGILTSTNTIQVNPSGAFTVSGRLGGANGLSMSGTGTLTLDNGSGGNTYTGETTINSGTVRLGATSQLADTSTANVNGGTLDVQTFNDTVLHLTLNSGSILGSTGILTSTDTIQVRSGNVSANLAGSNGLTKSTTGIVTLSGTNSYAGATVINDGTLTVSGGNAIPDTSNVTLANVTGATLNVQSNEIIGSLAGGGALGGNVTLGNVTLTIGATNLSTIFDGVIGGTGGIHKIGTGILTLTATESYAGDTDISGGTMLIHGSTSTTSDIAVKNGGTLGGNGVINGTVTVESGGTLNPGAVGAAPADVGKLTVANNVTFLTGSIFEVNINGANLASYDQLVITGIGTVVIELGANLSGTTGFIPANGTEFKLIDKQSLGVIVGVFSSLAAVPAPQTSPGTVLIGGKAYATSYLGITTLNDGNDFVLTATATARIWTGAANIGLTPDSDWSNSLNWLGNVAPFPGDNLVFPEVGAIAAANNNDLLLSGNPYTFGTITFTNTLTAYTLAGNTIVLDASGGGITNNSSLNNTVNLGINAQTNQQSINAATGTLTIGGNITLGAGGDLAVIGTGNVIFEGTINGSQALSIDNSGTVTFDAAVGSGTPLASITTTSAGTTRINAPSISTSGNQIYNNDVLIGGDTTLTGMDITFARTLRDDGNNTTSSNLTLNSSGFTTFGGVVGGANGTTALTSLTTDGTGTTYINGGGVRTVNGQTYNDAVSLGADVTLNAGEVLLHSVIGTGPADRSLVINTGNGNVTVQGSIGSLAGTDSSISTLDITGGAISLSNNVNVDGAITLFGNTSIISLLGAILDSRGHDISLSSNAINLGGPVRSTGSTGSTIALRGTSGSTTIGLGNGAAGTLVLSDATLSNIEDTFSKIIIGTQGTGANGQTGLITLDSSSGNLLIPHSAVEIFAAGTGGAVNIDSNVTLGQSGASFIIHGSGAGTSILSSLQISTNSGDIEIDDNLQIANGSELTLNTGTGNGRVLLDRNVRGDGGGNENLNIIAGAGEVILGNAIADEIGDRTNGLRFGNVQVTTTGNVVVNASMFGGSFVKGGNGGVVTFQSPLNLNGSVPGPGGSSLQVTANSITFSNDAAVTVAAGGGGVLLAGNPGGALGSVTIGTGEFDLTANQGAGFVIDPNFTGISLGSNIRTNAGQIRLSPNVMLVNNTVLSTNNGTATGADIRFDGKILGNGGTQSLTLQSGTGGDILAATATLGEGTGNQRLGRLEVTNSRNVFLKDVTVSTGISVTAAQVEISGNVNAINNINLLTTGNIHFVSTAKVWVQDDNGTIVGKAGGTLVADNGAEIKVGTLDPTVVGQFPTQVTVTPVGLPGRPLVNVDELGNVSVLVEIGTRDSAVFEQNFTIIARWSGGDVFIPTQMGSSNVTSISTNSVSPGPPFNAVGSAPYQTYLFTHTFLVNPNADPTQPLSVTFSVIPDAGRNRIQLFENGDFNNVIAPSITVLLAVPVGGLLTSVAELSRPAIIVEQAAAKSLDLPVALLPVTNQLNQRFDLGSGSSNAGGTGQRTYELRIVVPTNNAGLVKESKSIQLSGDVLDDLPGLFKRLPDDRYRIYQILEDGSEQLVKDFNVREQKAVDLEDLEIQEFPQQPAVPVQATPAPAVPVENDADSPAPLLNAPQGAAMEGIRIDESEKVTPHFGRSAALVGSLSTALALATQRSESGWNERVSDALKQFGHQSLSKAKRLLRK